MKKKSNIFKFVGLLIAALVLVTVLIFPATTQPVTITVLMQALEAAQWQPLVEKFNQEHSDIELTIVEGPNATNQVEDLYTSSFLLGRSPYDLVYMDIVWVPKFAAAGWLKDLSAQLTPEQEAEFLSGDLEGGKYQDKLYRMPFRSDGGMLYYRQDLLEQAGYQPPETFEELMTISQDLQGRNLAEWGYVWQGRQYEGLSAMFVEILTGFGGFWINPDTLEVGLDRPEAVAGVEFLVKTIEERISPPGVTTYAEEETRRLFQNGNVVFLRNWPYVFGLASQDDSPIQGKFAIKPMVSQPEHQSGACQGGWGLGIAKSSKHPQQAWEVVKFFMRPEVQREFVLNTGYVPSLRSLFNDPEIVAKYPHYPELLNVVNQASLRPPIPQYAQASDILQRYLSAALTKRMTPQKAMEAATRETNLLLNQRIAG